MAFLGAKWMRSTLIAGWLGLQGHVNAALPVTNRPVNDAEEDFRFAILPDRNGGMRPGVFEDAIAKTKLLQPAFVMSTGDLIDGYTTDPKVWNAEWEEFEAIVARLDMPFYYVPGNHDISNPLLLEAWKQRRGDPWFSFVYKNVLFVALHTEDRPFGGLGMEQIGWAKKTLADHANVRWTLLFFHRPLWLEKNSTDYEQVRAALKGRNYTVFSGHLHHYVMGERDGMKHYALATAGGDSKVRGTDVGEFDHLTWVTMKATGPVVVNLRLDGIVPDDVVSEAMLPRVDALRSGSWLRITSVVHPSPEFKELSLPLQLSNPTDFPLQVRGTLPPTAGISFTPSTFDRLVNPHATDTVPVLLTANGAAASIQALNEAGPTITLTGSYPLREKDVSLPTTQPVRLDWRHLAHTAPQPIILDGNLSEWPVDAFTLITRPMALNEGWDWTGPEDGRFRFAVEHREGKVYVALETFDDHVITSPNALDLQDKLYVKITTSFGATQREGIAGTATPDTNVRAGSSGLVGEFAFDLPAGEKTFRLNIGWVDHDRPENTKPSILWWRDDAVPEFGVFELVP